MTEQKVLELTKQLDFHAAQFVDTEAVVFEPSFRKFCEDNVCRQYAVTDTCPPGCGTTAEMEERIRAYDRALVMQTRWPITDYSDTAAIKAAKRAHNQAMLKLIDALGIRGVMAGASNCSICDPCRQAAGDACPFPEKKFSCMSAYCVYVKALAEQCGMEYFCKDGSMALFGLYAFRKEELEKAE